MLSSMTTSLQLAEECLKEEPSSGEQMADAAKPFEGLEMFAQTIEAGRSMFYIFFVESMGLDKFRVEVLVFHNWSNPSKMKKIW